MVLRYSSQGPMLQSQNGGYVASADYDKLEAEFKHLLENAAEYFRQIEAREITAQDAETALRVSVRISGL